MISCCSHAKDNLGHDGKIKAPMVVIACQLNPQGAIQPITNEEQAVKQRHYIFARAAAFMSTKTNKKHPGYVSDNLLS